MKNKKEVKVNDIINYSAVSEYLSGSNAIRSNQCPKKYKERVDELLLVVRYWMEKWGAKK